MSALFSNDTIHFLAENRLRNDKLWFEDHKDEYNKYVTGPLIALAEGLAPVLSEIDGNLICSPKVGGSVSRIWRDARFSRDKSLFRDTVWCMFVRRKGIGLPEFFFVVSPEEFLYGCGYYSAGAASMECIRELVLAGNGSFRTALSAYEAQDSFRLEGEMYKKSRHPEAPEKLRDWLDRKTICFVRRSADLELLFSEDLLGTVAEGYRMLAPLYRFLIEAEERVGCRPGM